MSHDFGGENYKELQNVFNLVISAIDGISTHLPTYMLFHEIAEHKRARIEKQIMLMLNKSILVLVHSNICNNKRNNLNHLVRAQLRLQ